MPASRPAFISIMMLALAGASPLAAQGTPLIGEAIAEAQQAAARDDCVGVLRALDPVVAGLASGPERLIAQRMRMLCLGAEGRAAELPAVQAELARATPRDGVVRAFGALIAADEDRFAAAADDIAFVAATSPDALAIFQGVVIREIAGRLTAGPDRQARNRMMIALTRADWEPSDLPELKVSFAAQAIEALVGQGEVHEAEALLDRVDRPEQLWAMMVDRHYARLWPAIEALMGPGGSASVDRFAREKLGRLGDAPDSDSALRDAANAMLLLGRYQDVLDLTDKVQIDDAMSRDAVFVMLHRARALAALRRVDDVDRLYAPFLKVDLNRAPAAATALIGYAEFLDEVGRSARALDVARRTRADAGGLLSDVGKRWLDRTEICALSALGEAADANRAADRLKANADQNRPAAIEALLCAHRDAEASVIALRAFGDAEIAADLLLQFQPAGALWAPAPSRLRDLWIAFLARPEIKAAFERNGRILPRNLWPRPGPRPIPRRPLEGGTLV